MNQPTASGINFREVDQDGESGVYAAPAEHELAGQKTRWLFNPFIAVLWLLAALLVGAGISALSTMMFTAGPINGPGALPFLMMTFAPHTLIIGVVLILCLLFWHAWQWQKHRS
ncbi:hypothetical protein [Pseudarthrobacter chlorophenolicus]|uniref:hypothetical protein n=1 Tax=Pseudarthrobacter chlorophenolicus TaxID=85085 RepID=UPI0005F29321|nr:hypothetical protein [Pseudarthrobacter chlorophenolicus]